jgi:arsenate reductase
VTERVYSVLQVNPYALALLDRMKIPARDARSESWDEFARPAAPDLDFVFTAIGRLEPEA